MFPSVVTDPRGARESLMEYLETMLYKDIFATSIVRKPEQIMHLTKLLASQIGSEVNYDNLSRETGISKTTIVEYLDLLEQCFIIRRCPSYSSGTVSELKKAKNIFCRQRYPQCSTRRLFDLFFLDMTPERCLRTSFHGDAQT